MIGNITKIKQYDLDILKKEIGTSFSTYDYIPQTLLFIMSSFCEKYNATLGVVLSNSMVSDFVIDTPLEKISLSQIENIEESSLFYIQINGSTNNKIMQNFLASTSLFSLTVVNLKDGGFSGGQAFITSISEPTKINIETVEYINKYGIIEQIKENQKIIKDSKSSTFSTDEIMPKAILVGVGRRGQDIECGLIELKSLCQTASIEVVGQFMQTRKLPDQQYYVGSGKLDEIKSLIQATEANLIVFDDELSGQRKFNLEEYLECKVIDRSMLILDIFASHATSNEGRLQVNLAQMKYSYPRLVAYQNSAGRFGSGGVGMRGPGETKLEMTKRILKDKIFQTEKEIEKLSKQRELRRQNRKINREKVVAIVGYTNSGKSTLLNKLTKSSVLAENKLFATLDTTTRELYLGNNKKILLTDTVGFIDKLPHEFIDAFSSTLEEATQADLLLIVVDNSSFNAQSQLEVVQSVISKLNASTIPQIILANKCDIKSELSFKASSPIIPVSAKTGEGLENLKKSLLNI